MTGANLFEAVAGRNFAIYKDASSTSSPSSTLSSFRCSSDEDGDHVDRPKSQHRLKQQGKGVQKKQHQLPKKSSKGKGGHQGEMAFGGKYV